MQLLVSPSDLTDDHIHLLGDDAVRHDATLLAAAAADAFSWRRPDLDEATWRAARQACADAWNACVAELDRAGGDKLAELRAQLMTVIAERLELEFVALLAERAERMDPGIDAWVAYDPAARSWRVADAVRHIPCGERALGIRVDDPCGAEMHDKIIRTMRDLSC